MIQPMAFRMFSPPGRLLLEQTGEEAADLRAGGLGDRVTDHRGELRHHVRRQPQLEKAPLTSARLLNGEPPSSGPAALVTSPRPGTALLMELNWSGESLFCA